MSISCPLQILKNYGTHWRLLLIWNWVDHGTIDDLQKATEQIIFIFGFKFMISLINVNLLGSLTDNMGTRLEVDSSKVQLLFHQLCTKKSKWPDGISGLLLTTCAVELIQWCTLFQRSLEFPHSGKDLWSLQFQKSPICLRIMTCSTNINWMKWFEKYIVSLLKSEATFKLDTWQFAYRQGKSTDDAV